MNKYKNATPAAFILAASLLAAPANAETIKVDAVVETKESIRLDFKDGSKHFVAMVRREGRAEGQGSLSGAAVVEYGTHDVVPGVSGEPRGYLVFTRPDGDIAYVRWLIHASFVPGADGKPTLIDNGLWEVVGGSGKLATLKGAGTLHLRPESETGRRFILEGVTFGGH